MRSIVKAIAFLALAAAAAKTDSTQSTDRAQSTPSTTTINAPSSATHSRDSANTTSASNTPSTIQHIRSTGQPAVQTVSNPTSKLIASPSVSQATLSESNLSSPPSILPVSSSIPGLVFPSSSAQMSTSKSAGDTSPTALSQQASTSSANHHTVVYIVFGVLGGIFGLGAIALCCVTSRGALLRKLGFGRSSAPRLQGHGHSDSLDSLFLRGDYLRPKDEILGSWSQREDTLDPIRMTPLSRSAVGYN